MTLAIYMLFAVAGLLVGGTWTVYKSGSMKLTIVVGLLAVIATATAIFWYLGAVN